MCNTVKHGVNRLKQCAASPPNGETPSHARRPAEASETSGSIAGYLTIPSNRGGYMFLP